MLEQAIYNFMLGKANDSTINPTAIKIRGNFNFVIIGDTSYMYDTSTSNAYDVEKVRYIPMAKTMSKEIAFVEDNNRSDWLQQYAFMFPESMKAEMLNVLQRLRDYFLQNPLHTVADTKFISGVDTATNYKYAFKISRPEGVFTSPPQGGEIWHTYIMQIQATSIVTGSFCDSHTVEMKVTGGTYQTLAWDNITIQTGVSMNPSNKITTVANMTNKPIGSSTTGTFEINYDGTALHDIIYKLIGGNYARTTSFTIKTTFATIAKEYVVHISGGSYTLKKRAVFKMLFNWVEI